MREDLLPKTFSGGLDRLIQECAEVIVATAKLNQYGDVATDDLTGITHDNVEKMISKLIDLDHASMRIRYELQRRGFMIPEQTVPVTTFIDEHPDLFK